MRAMTVGSPATLDTLKLVELPDAGQPGPNEVLVRLYANSLNFHDYLVVNGTIPTAESRVPMSDAGGEVLAVGEGVTEFKAGDNVVSTFHTRWPQGRVIPANAMKGVPGDGVDGYAREAIVAPAEWFTRAPKGYSHQESATLSCAAVTAWRVLAVDGPVIAGQTVLVLGTGGVSIFALQFAKAMGATVVATSSSDEKLERLKQLGADHLINYKSTPEWGQVAYDLTGGIDHVIDIGGAGTLPQSINAVKAGGHIALVGVLAGFKGEIPTAVLTRKLAKLLGAQVGSRADQIDMIAAIDATGIKPVIDRSFPLDALGDAFRHQISGAHFGKIVVDI